MIKEYFEWDVANWSKALELWEKVLKDKKEFLALDIGSRAGGLSLMLANNYFAKVICSDLSNPEKTASQLHSRFLRNGSISYEAIDCTLIPYADNSFDVVIFKSVIGALGNREKQETAVSEMYRVLKPGGVLLFAENLKASWLHMFLRRRFNKWSAYWYYPTIEEIRQYLKRFSTVTLHTNGFFATFTHNKQLRNFLSKIDSVSDFLWPLKMRYIIYGAAVK